MKTRPRLSFWQIWNMSFGFLGIQFGFALQNANVSRIFESLGADVGNLALYWLAAPLTGLIVQPIIGYLSDNTWTRFGRRRPYFLVGAIMASVCLLIMPNSPMLWVAVGMLWILDASINISMEPFRAFVGDMLPPEQRTKGFAMQSFFIGVGAVVGSGLPYILSNWLGVSSTPEIGKSIPPNLIFSFYTGAAVFFLAVLWTVLKTKEYSPEQLTQFEITESGQIVEGSTENDNTLPAERFFKFAPLWTLLGLLGSALIYYFKLKGELFIMSGGLLVFGLIQYYVGLLVKSRRTKSGLVVVINDLFKMPKTMSQLAIVQFFSWFALFSMWIYSTPSITSNHFNMRLDAEEVMELGEIAKSLKEQETAQWTDSLNRVLPDLEGYLSEINSGAKNIVASMRVVVFFESETNKGYILSAQLKNSLDRIKTQYNKGADWVNALFSFYNGFAAILAFLLPVMARYTNRRITHMTALILGGLGLISIYFFTDPNMLIISMLGVGVAWASILSMPYAMLTSSLPAHKMGTYMGIFNFFIVIPQILAASILGLFVTTVAGGQPIYAFLLGGFSLFIAAFLVLFVTDADEQLIKNKQNQ